MEQFNKVISFVLGLVVVVIFLAVATGKINLKGTTLPFSKNTSTAKITPSPTPKKITPIAKVTGIQNTSSNTYNPDYRPYGSKTPNTIPNTGPELLLPMVVTSLFAGLYLQGKGKK